MKKLLNTLYITTPNAYLSKDGFNIVVSVEQKEIFRIPILNIEAVITFGYIGASLGLMKLCADNGVALTFLSPNGQFIARVQGAVKGNVLLRKLQYNLSDNDEFALNISKLFVSGKIHNYRSILRRFIRDYGGDPDIIHAEQVLLMRKNELQRAISLNQLRGIEGDAAYEYFKVFHKLILHQRDDFPFNGRNRRPPKDAINAMLSFVYTLIGNDVATALETVGLDPYVGFLHALRPGRTSLALDLMEELRAYIGDRLVLSLINRRQITAKDFYLQGSESVVMTDDARKTILTIILPDFQTDTIMAV